MSNRLLPAMVVAAFLLPLSATAQQRVAWTGEPIQLRLEVGTERRVVIPAAEQIRVGIPADAAANLVVQSIGSSTWWTAGTQFERKRVLVQIEPGAAIVVFEVQAQDNVENGDTNLIVAVPEKTDGPVNLAATEPPGFVELTRWAMQQVYSPLRLRSSLDGVVRHVVHRTPLRLFRCGPNQPSTCGGAVEAVPVAAWRSPTHFVTMVELTNTLDQPVVLDPRELRGGWRTATFAHARLRPAADPESTTILVLISDRPASETLH